MTFCTASNRRGLYFFLWITTQTLALVMGAKNERFDTFQTISGELLISHLSDIGSTKVTLNGGEYTAFTRRDGRFAFHDVRPGLYVLDVLCPTHAFSQVKFEVGPEGDRIRAVEFKHPGAAQVNIAHPFVLRAQAKWFFFEKRESFGIRHIIANPMVLMMGFTLVMVFIMPKMMENMDPEERKQMEEQMQQSGDPGKLFKQLLGQGGDDEDDD